jgi:uncharacterized protein (UPF0333 family)
MKRGQVSIEFITIFGFVFLMMIPLIIVFFDQSQSVQDAISQNHLRNVAIKMTDKAETVYYLGEPSRTTIKAYFPEKIESVNITSRTIIFNFRTYKNTISSITSTALVNISGNISSEPGLHYIEIKSVGEGVSISG